MRKCENKTGFTTLIAQCFLLLEKISIGFVLDGIEVNISLVISNIADVDEVEMEFSTEMFMREIWRDSRLVFDPADFDNSVRGLLECPGPRSFCRFHDAPPERKCQHSRFERRLTEFRGSDQIIFKTPRNIKFNPRVLNMLLLKSQTFFQSTFQTEMMLHEDYVKQIWHPDTYVPNAVTSKNPRTDSISHRSLLRQVICDMLLIEIIEKNLDSAQMVSLFILEGFLLFWDVI